MLRTIDNPLNGILPDFSLFGVEFTQLWQKLLAAGWGIALVLAVLFVILAAVKMSGASASQNTMEYAAARKGFVNALIGLAVVAGISVIIGAVLSAVG